MKTRILKRIIICLTLFMTTLFPLHTLAEENIKDVYSDEYSNKSYILNKYEVNIILNENNVLDVEEKIGAMFNIDKHGIIRRIPIVNSVKREDGTKENNRVKISDIEVNSEYRVSIEDKNKVIKIGSPSTTLKGQQNYTIKYKYDIGKDHNKDYDELYYNIIGTGWDTAIENITFTIQMPKDFDKTKIGFTSGNYGSYNTDNVVYEIDGNKIIGKYVGRLDSEEALTIRIQLPEGYFKNAGLNVNLFDLLLYIIPIVGAIISYMIWHKYGKDHETIEVLEFYPPEGYNSLEIGYLYKGKAYSEDVISLLIYLANKGYIKITETESKDLFSLSSGFKIEKIKEYDGNNINEKMFFEGLFKPSSAVDYKKVINMMKEYKARGERLRFNDAVDMCKDNNPKKVVTDKDLYDRFYLTVNKIQKRLENDKLQNMIHENKSTKKSPIIILLIVLSAITSIAVPTLAYSSVETSVINILMLFIISPFLIEPFIFKENKVFSVIFFIGICILAFQCYSETPLAVALTQDKFYLIGFIVALICIVVMLVILKYLPKRTKYGAEILGRIKGFKKFLETAEKDNLEAMVLQNPSYFYDILPYTYVLGISDKWIKKFESINLKAPTWFEGSSSFDLNSFSDSFSRTMSEANSAMSSSASSGSSGSSGGGSSGGGCSGGGSGGGGGSSW